VFVEDLIPILRRLF